jgi:hypothetical protein
MLGVSPTLYVHPVLLVHGASEWHHPNGVEMVPHLYASHPLLHPMTLALQTPSYHPDIR